MTDEILKKILRNQELILENQDNLGILLTACQNRLMVNSIRAVRLINLLYKGQVLDRNVEEVEELLSDIESIE